MLFNKKKQGKQVTISLETKNVRKSSVTNYMLTNDMLNNIRYYLKYLGTDIQNTYTNLAIQLIEYEESVEISLKSIPTIQHNVIDDCLDELTQQIKTTLNDYTLGNKMAMYYYDDVLLEVRIPINIDEYKKAIVDKMNLTPLQQEKLRVELVTVNTGHHVTETVEDKLKKLLAE